jgi:archaellum biogenesis ATPase FlaH
MDKLSSVNLLIEKKKELEKELENYLSELVLCEEVYSFLTAPLYVLYKAYKGELATESAVNLLVKELNNLPYKVSKFYLHKNEIGKYISNEESIRTLVTSEKNKLEKIIRIIQTKRRDIEESLKYWIDEKLGKRLPEIENEIKI